MKILPRHAACLALVIGLFLTLPITASPQTSDRKQNQTTAAPSPQELFGRLSPSVFVVEALNKRGSVVATGSAVAVAPDEVVTNKHVIKEGVAWRVRHGSKTWPAILTHLDSAHDLCQLKADGLNAPPVPVRASSTLAVGERVYAIGAPEGLELSLSEGLISGLREFEKVRLIQTSAAISHGSSGGGLFDAQGRLVGITTFFLKEGQNLNFALPGEWVQALATQQFSANQKAPAGRVTVDPSQVKPVTGDSPAFSALAWFHLGNQADKAGDYEKAVKAYQEAIRLKPVASVWCLLGFTYVHLKQYDQAVKAYQEAIRLKPDNAEAWFLLGNPYVQLKQYDQAVKAYQEAIRLKPDDFYAWCLLGSTYVYHLKQYDQAVKAYQEAIRLKPDDADAWFLLGTPYVELDQYDQAVKAFQEAIRLKPDNAEAWYYLGDAYDKLRQYNQAIAAYQEAVRLKPDYAEAWFSLGNPYVQLDQYGQAVKAFQEAIRLKPDYARAWYCLGLTYSLQHNRSKMMQVYEMLKTLDRDQADEFFQKFVLP